MLSFEVNDMTCGHCVGAITRAVAGVDPDAAVEVDLPSHQVRIGSDASNADAFGNAIQQAGYTPVRLTDAAPALAEAAPRKGCCCGSALA